MKICGGRVSVDLAGMLMTEALSVFSCISCIDTQFNCEMAMMKCEMM